MQARGARVLITLSLLFGALVATGSPAAATSVTPDSTISYVSEPGDYVGQGTSGGFAASPDTNFAFYGSSRYIVAGATADNGSMSVVITPPPGRRLEPGVYEEATTAGLNVGTVPGVSIYGLGHGCNQYFGRFVIYQVFFDENDEPLLVDADIESHCERVSAPAIRVHLHASRLTDQNPPTAVDDRFVVESDTTESLSTAEFIANDRDPDIGDAAVSVEIAAPPTHGALTPSAGGFDYTPDPAYDGFDGLTYRAVDGTGRRSSPATVTFEVGTPPQDRFSYSGDLADSVSRGTSGEFTRSDSTFSAGGSSEYFRFQASGHQDSWYVILSPSAGQTLVPGRYDEALRTPNQGVHPSIDISANGTGCNATFGSFTINAIGFDADGTPNMLDADLEQHCESPTAPALHASIRYHIPAVRPVTNTDEFNAAGTTDVPSPGVLANDTDADPRNTLTSSIMSRPLHGSVTLDPSGAFRYQPVPGFVGDDRFVYRAADPFGLKSVPTIVTMHTTLPPAKDSVWVHAVNRDNTEYVIGGPITGGDVRVTTRSGIILLNGTLTVPDRLGGSATITFTTRPGSVAGSVIGTATVTDALLGGTSRFRVTDTRSAARHRAGGHALRISGSVGRITFSAHDRVTPAAQLRSGSSAS